MNALPTSPAYSAFLAGAWTQTGRTFEVHSPAMGETIAIVADCGLDEARRAAVAAHAAFLQWRARTPWDRAPILQRWGALILQHEVRLAHGIAREMGKPVTEAKGEIRYSAALAGDFAEEAKRVFGELVPSQFADKRLLVTKRPVGPVLAITPWNFPALMIMRKAAAALAAGCTVIVKPAEQSPLTALELAQLWEEAGGPPGTLQVLPTSDPAPLAAALLDDVTVRKLTFTGSTEVGILLNRHAAATLKHVSLELGGHAPYLVFGDADVAQAARDVAASKFRNAGQTCICTNRVYVQRGIADAFEAELARVTAALRVGDPLQDVTQIGPLVDAAGLRKVEAHVADALAHGAHVLTGGRALGGLFYEPTVLSGVTDDMLIMREETFGPVAPVLRFDDEAEAIARANDTPFGLAAYVWTRDVGRVFRVSEALEYGIIGVNDPIPSTAQAPFGGTKASGLGREQGKWGLEAYLETKFTSVRLA
ncbi:MAG: NAD-dependent succinate-semialdehyde dehydrogenase [Chloroflexi bacterium]|nr:NAD-dependent succinate-semialdehyde dehydrogenase [Chloroflexota bacterium]